MLYSNMGASISVAAPRQAGGDLPISPVILVENLVFQWKKSANPLLDIPSFAIAPQERFFLLGGSGSGKSTLLAILAGVLAPQQGVVQVLATDLAAIPSSRRDCFRADHFGVIFQQFNLIPSLSMLDNVTLPCHFSAIRKKRAEENAGTPANEARRLLKKLGLSDELIKQPVSHLSVGQQQRVAAARALIGAPEIIIADEPTSALDTDRRNDFLELLFTQCEAAKSTLVFVSHDMALASSFDRTVALAAINRRGEML